MRLLNTVEEQEIYPDEIIIVDSSRDNRTRMELERHPFESLRYFKVQDQHRGLTRQRNFGVMKVSPDIEVICFLDDDTMLEPTFFKEILRTYEEHPEAVGVSGYITNETEWQHTGKENGCDRGYFHYDGWSRVEGSRFQLRRILGLSPSAPPGFMPDFSHGYSTGFLPPSGKTYEVEMLMGGLASYRNSLFQKIIFSPFFEGYGLYEDADFSLRASKIGKLYVNTAAKISHHHAVEGRPDSCNYGKMVIRNGWYVWKVKYQTVTWKAKMKFISTSILLTLIRIGNGLEKKEGLKEGFGRLTGLWSLIINPPKP